MEFFEKFFGSGFAGGGSGSGSGSGGIGSDVRGKESRCKDIVHQMSVQLEELYNGSTRRIAFQRNVICDKCDGRCGKKDTLEQCTQCGGNGVETRVQHISPEMVQQVELVCRKCFGSGETISEEDCCKQCFGRQTIREQKVLEVHIEKGMRDGQKIIYSGEGDQAPDAQTGDIVISLNEKQHSSFVRSGADLFMKMPIQLIEALCGFTRIIKTLDNRKLLITSPKDEVIRNDITKCISDEGMPFYKNPMVKGRLIVQFEILFPIATPQAVIPTLEQCLPPRPVVPISVAAEHVSLENFDPNERRQQQNQRNAYEEDERDYDTGPKIQQCSSS